MGFFDRIRRAFTGEDETLVQRQEEDSQKKIVFDDYERGMEKTRQSFSEKINALFSSFDGVDDEFFDDLEEVFISADVGFDMTIALADALRDDEQVWRAKSSDAVKRAIVEHLVAIYEKGGTDLNALAPKSADGPTVILFVGVNGVGKTTTIGKLASRLQKEGNKVLLAAGDTFRAGAIEQIEVWGKRIGVPVVEGQMGGDPASVVFDAIKKAKEDKVDYLLVDTAGRLQNKINLMNELEKIKRIISREIPGGAQEVLLVLDATTGQNALVQAKQFNETTNITGLVLTKLDGTAKGGVILAIRHELDIPVKFVGLGEKVEDLKPFAADEYMYGLVKDLIDKQG